MGTGYNFSSLRPRGAIVKSTGKSSSGVIPFLRAYDAACGAVNQGGCVIGSTLVMTPFGLKQIKDIKKKSYVYSFNNGKQIVTQCSKSWITKKDAEVWKIKTTNLEFFATPDHRFMISDGTYVELKDLKPNDKLKDIGNKEECVVSVEYSHNEDVYDIEVPLTSNYAVANRDVVSGVYIHNSRRGANMSILNCLEGNTLIHTVDGKFPIKDLVGQQPYLYACNPETKTVHVIQAEKVFISDYNRQLVRVLFDNDDYIDCTPDHRFLLSNGEYLEAEKLTIGKNLMTFSEKNISQNKTNDKIVDNYKVIKVETINIADKVYDITVPTYHNFVANGVFVHNCNHPDLMEFLACKDNNDSINNFNLSVGVTDEFFDAVEKDKDWELYFNDENGNRVKFYPNGDEEQTPVTEYVVKAKDIYDLIIKQAHNNGEPGIIFLDRLQEGNSVPSCKIIATNPCLTGDTLIAVTDSRNVVSLEQLYKEFESNKDGFNVETYGYDSNTKETLPCKIQFILNQGIKEVFKLVLSDGSFVKATENHKFILANGERSELKDLKIGDELIPFFVTQCLNTVNLEESFLKIDNVETIKSFENQFNQQKSYIVKEIVKIGEENVYDLHVPNTNSVAIVTQYKKVNQSGDFDLLNINNLSGIIVGNCGEQPLPPNNACVLSSINLGKHLKEDLSDMDWDLLDNSVKTTVRLLDNIVSVNEYPIPEIKIEHDKQRRIGLTY